MKAKERKLYEAANAYAWDIDTGDLNTNRDIFIAGAEWQKKQDIDKAVRWKENSDVNKPAINHSVLIKSSYGIAEGEWQGEQWLQYRWQSKIKDNDVEYWMELNELKK